MPLVSGGYFAEAEPVPGFKVKAWQSWPELRRTTAEGRLRDLKPIRRQPWGADDSQVM